jgi:dipeptidyl aminopeptidase/acylaminoacyl peptidase
MQPAWHPDGSRIAWIDWNHPNMPWDGTFLRLGQLGSSTQSPPILEDVATIAGGDEVSIFQPEFSPDGTCLAYVSDASGWWQLYVYDLASGQHRQLTFEPAEHGAPAWVQGLRTYGFAPDGSRLFFLRNQNSFSSLWQLDLATGQQRRVELDGAYTQLDHLQVSAYGLAMLASGGQTPSRVISLPLPPAAGQQPVPAVRIWRRSSSEELPAEAYSQPQAISWTGMDGGTAYGLYYPPCSAEFTSDGAPPLIVQVHGGPTGQTRPGFQSQVQFFTSRGYAVLDVNYRGSTGYGREYRNKLRGSWGIYDVQDTVSGVQYLAAQGLADLKRAVITGGSAGGFTVLKALEDFPGFFKAGICLFGVSNQFTLAAETHKFEAHYSDSLLGPLPEAADLYRERSPIFFTDRIQDPLAVFQGEEDVVVPRKQSDEVVDALRRRGVPHIYHTYAGEGHGFRKVETLDHYLKAVERFLKEFVIFS